MSRPNVKRTDPSLKGTGFSPCSKHEGKNRASAPKATPIFKSIFAFVCLAALVAPAVSAQTQTPWDKIPIPKLHDFKPQQPKRIELKNGIVLFLQEDHELPFISGSILIPCGSRDEDPAKTGLIGLYGQAWRTSGTAKMDGDAMDDFLEAKAAHIETGGDDDSTALSWDSLKGDADQVFSLALNLFLHPKFDQEKLQLAQQQEATGIVRRNDEENGIAGREAAKLAYGPNSPYTRQPELATIGAVTVADLQAWHDRTIAGKLIVSISGDFDPVAMEAKLRSAFEGMPPAKPLPERHDTFTSAPPGVYFINKTDVNQSEVEVVGMGIDRHNPDVPIVAILDEILGGGFNSRLFQKVRTDLGLAYATGGGISFGYDYPGTFHAFALTKSATTVEAAKAILAEISGLNSRPFTEEELARAKDNIVPLQIRHPRQSPGRARTPRVLRLPRRLPRSLQGRPRKGDSFRSRSRRQEVHSPRQIIHPGSRQRL